MNNQIKVAFYKDHARIFDRLAQWWLRGNYSHCELVLDTDTDGISICASSSAMDGGVRIKYIQLNPDHWDLVSVHGNIHNIRNWLLKNIGQKYDYLGFIGLIARRFGQNKNRWFCSEAVAEMLGMQECWRFDPCSLWAALSKSNEEIIEQKTEDVVNIGIKDL